MNLTLHENTVKRIMEAIGKDEDIVSFVEEAIHLRLLDLYHKKLATKPKNKEMNLPICNYAPHRTCFRCTLCTS